MDRRTLIGSALMAGVLLACGRPRPPASSPGTASLGADAFRRLRRFASTPSGRIAYVERGTGPAALFIHGFPLNGFQWRGALERLAGERRCLVPDLMGLGYTEVSAQQDVGPEAQAEMLLQFIDALGQDAVDLVASDSGGAIAQILVVRRPERFRTLLLTNCDVHEDNPPPAVEPVIAGCKAGTFFDQVLAPQLRDFAVARGPDGLGGCCYTRPQELAAETIEYYLAPLASSPSRKDRFHAYGIELGRNVLVALEPALAQCQVPLRVVWGTGDRIFSVDSPGWLDRTFPRSRGVRLVEGANLFFPEEMPDLIAEEARRLWGVT